MPAVAGTAASAGPRQEEQEKQEKIVSSKNFACGYR
jgi:hypothetical protein